MTKLGLRFLIHLEHEHEDSVEEHYRGCAVGQVLQVGCALLMENATAAAAVAAPDVHVHVALPAKTLGKIKMEDVGRCPFVVIVKATKPWPASPRQPRRPKSK